MKERERITLADGRSEDEFLRTLCHAPPKVVEDTDGHNNKKKKTIDRNPW